MKQFFYYWYLWLSKLSHVLSTVHHLHTARFAKPHEVKRISDDVLNGKHILIGEGGFHHILAVSPTEKQKELGARFRFQLTVSANLWR